MSVQNRLKALEDRAGLGQDLITVVVRRIVRPGEMEPARIIRNYGTQAAWRVEREPSESLDAFRERAYRECPHRDGELTRLIERSGGV